VLAGFCGGIARGLVEGPFEYIKTRRQVAKHWFIREVFTGSGPTVFRNSILFGLFVSWMDLEKLVSKKYFGLANGLPPFFAGALCANLSWAAVWPIDVVKSQIQSGKFEGRSFFSLFVMNLKSPSALYRGILPGLMRSTIANGCSMVVYTKILQYLKEERSLRS